MSFEVDLDSLLNEFYSDRPQQDTHLQLGTFDRIDEAPSPYNDLLNHNHHMTVTVEAFHGESVNVSIHRHQQHDNKYCREITLVTEQSKKIVQYGIVRLNKTALVDRVWRQIESGEIPLGRVLIENNVLRDVKIEQLWAIKAGPCLAEKMHAVIGQTFYGRTAIIHCDGVSAIELLEIVSTA